MRPRHLLALAVLALSCSRRPRLQISKDGPIVWPHEIVACTSDAQCMIISLGCCSETPVHRAHEDEAREALAASGREHCPVKAACGPSAKGSWDGEPARCRDGVCAWP